MFKLTKRHLKVVCKLTAKNRSEAIEESCSRIVEILLHRKLRQIVNDKLYSKRGLVTVKSLQHTIQTENKIPISDSYLTYF